MPKLSAADLKILKDLYQKLRFAKDSEQLADPDAAIRRTVATLIGHKIIENKLAAERNPEIKAQLTASYNDPDIGKNIENSHAFHIWYQDFDIWALSHLCENENGLDNVITELTEIEKEVSNRDENYVNALATARRAEYYTHKSALFEFFKENGSAPGVGTETRYNNPWGIIIDRHALNSAAFCYMINNGVPIDDVFKPFANYRRVQNAGKEVCERFIRASEEDKKWFADNYVKSIPTLIERLNADMKKFAGMPLSEVMKPGNRESVLVSVFIQDPAQEKDHFKNYVMETYGEKYIDDLGTEQAIAQAPFMNVFFIGSQLHDSYVSPVQKKVRLGQMFKSVAIYEYLTKQYAEVLKSNPNIGYLDGKGNADFELPSILTAVLSAEESTFARLLMNGNETQNISDVINGRMTDDIELKITVTDGVPDITVNPAGRAAAIERRAAEENARRLAAEAAEEARAEAAFKRDLDRKIEKSIEKDLEALRRILEKMDPDVPADERLADPKGAVTACLAHLFAGCDAEETVQNADDLHDAVRAVENMDKPETVAAFRRSDKLAEVVEDFNPKDPEGLRRLTELASEGISAVRREYERMNTNEIAVPGAAL